MPVENQNKYSNAISLCMKKKPDVAITPTNKDQKKLIAASKRGDIDSIHIQLAKGVDVNSKDSDGMTALVWAARRGYIDIIRILLRKGADPKGKDIYGWTAMDWATRRGYNKVIKLLKSFGATQ